MKQHKIEMMIQCDDTSFDVQEWVLNAIEESLMYERGEQAWITSAEIVDTPTDQPSE